MGKLSWRAWAGVVAVGAGVLAGGPAWGQGAGRAPAAGSAEVEATRLREEVSELIAQGKYDEALRLAQRSVVTVEKALGPEHPTLAAILNEMAVVYDSKGDFARAEPLYQRCLAILERAFGPDHPTVGTALNNLAVSYADRGDHGRAGPLLRRVLAIREKTLGPDHPDLARYLNTLAMYYMARGDHARAEPLHRRALAIREEVLGPEHPDVAVSINNLAAVHMARADYAGAESLNRRALAIREKALGPDHPDVGRSLNNLGDLYKLKGDYVRAEPLLRRAVAILTEALGSDHPDVATSLYNLAVLYEKRGDYARAESLTRQALAIRERTLGPEHPDVGRAMNSLALLYEARGDLERAELLQQRAVAILERALGSDHPDVAALLGNLAGIYNSQGDAARAEPLLQRAVSILEKTLGPDHPDVAVQLNRLAWVYGETRDYERAERAYQRSLTTFEASLGARHPNVSIVLANLAMFHVLRGQLREGVTDTQRMIDIDDHLAGAILTAGSEEQKRLYMDTVVPQMHWGVSLHVQHAPASPDAARLALTTLLRRKGRILDAMADSLAALRRSVVPGDQELLARLKAVYSELAAESASGLRGSTPAQYRERLVGLERQRQSLEEDIGRHSAAFRAEQQPVTLSAVQAALPEGAALVELARYRPLYAFAGKDILPGPLRYVAYVLRPSGDPAFADLGEAGAIDAAVHSLRRALADHDRTHDPKPSARALDRLLMEPVRKLLGDARQVFLSPDGPLHLIPFGALVDEEGRYLVERYHFSYLTAGRDLLRFGDLSGAPRGAPLVLANPAFDESSAPAAPEGTHRGVRSIDMITQRLSQLQGTEAEARTIAGLFQGSRVLMGPDATEEAIKGARGPAFLHVATHGFFLPEQPVPEALLRAPGRELTPAERAALLQRENPLLRSVIALAGFNRRKSGIDDGVLTALEAAGLDLHGTRLVVLSTCESGVGEASSGEGVYGLRRALTMAGAETQVMSLWQVDTGRTRELMQAYYQRLKAGAGRSEAMREVQLAMLANPRTAHPNLWASFIVSGDWRSMEVPVKLPAGKVAPGVRGCGCEVAGEERRAPAAWAAAALGLAAAARRRRRRQEA